MTTAVTPKEFLKKTLKAKRTDPLWKGPERDGITFSMLSRFLTCKERFRVNVIEGLAPPHSFDHRIEYGHMFHLCDETNAAGKDWAAALAKYVKGLGEKYKLDRHNIARFHSACMAQFPAYVAHWKGTDRANRQVAVDQEWVFDSPYILPSGRTVRLRGKTDGNYKHGKLWAILETKTKGEIDVVKVLRQMTFDLQTMIYVVALQAEKGYDGPVKVTYNLVKRPLGHGSIRQLKPSKKNPRGETLPAFYARLGGTFRENPDEHFQRVEAQVNPLDVKRFKEKCLDPLLENVACWYDAMTGGKPVVPTYALHWLHPFGVRNFIDEGGSTDLDEYILTGVPVGLERREKLFTELT